MIWAYDTITNYNEEVFKQFEIDEEYTDPVKKIESFKFNENIMRLINELPFGTERLLLQLRKNIRDYNNYTNTIKFYYKIKCLNSLFPPYSVLNENPGINILTTIPGGRIIMLKMPYQVIGFEKLNNVIVSEKKWFIECFGYPNNNIDVKEYFYNIWSYYDQQYRFKSAKKDLDLGLEILAAVKSSYELGDNNSIESLLSYVLFPLGTNLTTSQKYVEIKKLKEAAIKVIEKYGENIILIKNKLNLELSSKTKQCNPLWFCIYIANI